MANPHPVSRKGKPNKLKARRAEEVARSGKRAPAENLRIIAERAMSMAAKYQPKVIDEKTKEPRDNPMHNEERYGLNGMALGSHYGGRTCAQICRGYPGTPL